MTRSDHNDKPDMTKHNRVRLMQQNKRLVAEIQKLDHIISNMLEKTASSDY